MNLTEDILLEIIQKSSIRDIKALCQTCSNIYKLCKHHKNLIYNTKCKDLKSFLQKNNTNIILFANKNNFFYDENSPVKRFSIIYDRIWINLMFLLYNKLFDEAEVLLTCTKLPEPPLGLFFQKYIENMPQSLMTLLINNFPNILDLFGYESKEDLLDDFPINTFKNKTLRNIIQNI